MFNGQFLRAKEYNGKAQVKFLHAKLDGHRVMVEKLDHGQFMAITRTNCNIADKLLQVPHIAELLNELPKFTSVDCELHCPGVHATSVKTMINAADPKLQISPFAMPMFKGDDIRQQDLPLVMKYLGDLGFKTPELIARKTTSVLTQDEVEHYKVLAGRQSYEGWVAKERHYHGWWKIKPVRTVDCVVIDYEISESMTWGGGLKALVVAVKRGTELVKVAQVGSGFDGEFRMNCDPKSLVGKVCEVSYDSLASKGLLKFPRFERWRDDKVAAECTYDQLEVES